MLTSKDSFTSGELEIGQVTDPDVALLVDKFIAKYEDEYLRFMFGYEAYEKFIESISSVNPEQRWLDLLNGCKYIDRNQVVNKFDGLVSTLDSLNLVKTWPEDIEITVGGNKLFEPLAGTRSYTNPNLPLIKSDWRLMRAGFGTMRTDMFTKREDGFDIPMNDIFEIGESWIIQFKDAVYTPIQGVVSTLRDSPISYYVYYWYQRNNASFSTGGGESIPNKQNSRIVTNRRKQVLAWNRMVDLNSQLLQILRFNPNKYPEFNRYAVGCGNAQLRNLLSKQNLLNF